MIKTFKNIRRKLNEGKPFTRCLFYTLGEII